MKALRKQWESEKNMKMDDGKNPEMK